MVRRFTAALGLLNVVLLAWLLLADTSGRDEREPGRLQQQVQPDSVQVLPAEEAGAAASSGDGAATPAPVAGTGASAGGTVSVSSAAAMTAALAAGGLTAAPASAVPAGMGASTAAGGLGAVTGAVTALNAVCLEAGPFDAKALPAAEAVLAAELPQGSWRRQLLQPAPAYLVYLGRFSDQKTAQRRVQELRQRGFQAELARDLPALEPGVVLSRHAQAAQAEAALEALQAQRNGPRTARVVSTGEAAAVLLRVEHPTDEVRDQLAGLEPTPALRGGFRGCRKPPQTAGLKNQG
ncbi:hypothetical protein [Azohydromonas aeria]|uniref:hypothetical protein n=1 Tax=Azohydromonas aeria TaxID=2590212 RepID=UPI0012FB6AC4|nr:hypothetical protein [Azohydromonas aeria]